MKNNSVLYAIIVTCHKWRVIISGMSANGNSGLVAIGGMTIALTTATATANANASPHADVAIRGWQEFDLNQDKPPQNFGKDPVLGRLVCPPMTRLNLLKGRNEGLLIQDPQVVNVADKDAVEWHIPLRSGIYWWSGKAVSVKDLAEFWRTGLDTMQSKPPAWLRLAGISVPKFSIDSRSRNKLVIRWQQKPKFGPYVLNGQSLYKPTSSGSKERSYECAGLYEPASKGEDLGLRLVATPGYRRPRPTFGYSPMRSKTESSPSPQSPQSLQSSEYDTDQKSSVDPQASEVQQPTDAVLFTTADAISGNPWTRKSDDPAACQLTLDQPYVSSIVWNLGEPPYDKVALRNLLTNLTPRGALLRSGAGRLGELVSGPIVRQHPGYNPNMRIKPFDIPAAAQGLQALGYLRSAPDGPRLTPEGQPFVVRIGLLKNSSGLTGKVITDGFAALGIKVETAEFQGRWKNIDGVLTGLRLDWPGHDFIADFHSSREISQLPPLRIAGLDELLEAYSISLTFPKPRFELLRKVHGKLYEVEPMTTLFQHKACVALRGIGAAPKALNVLDPDWFKKLVL